MIKNARWCSLLPEWRFLVWRLLPLHPGVAKPHGNLLEPNDEPSENAWKRECKIVNRSTYQPGSDSSWTILGQTQPAQPPWIKSRLKAWERVLTLSAWSWNAATALPLHQFSTHVLQLFINFETLLNWTNIRIAKYLQFSFRCFVGIKHLIHALFE